MELKARAEENKRKRLEKEKNKWPFNASNPRFRKNANIIKTTKVGPGEYYDPS